jgi:hypothetical protein
MSTRTTGIFLPLPNPSSPDKRPHKKGGKIRADSATAQGRRGQRERERERERERARARARARAREERIVLRSIWGQRVRQRLGREGRTKSRELLV